MVGAVFLQTTPTPPLCTMIFVTTRQLGTSSSLFSLLQKLKKEERYVVGAVFLQTTPTPPLKKEGMRLVR